MRRAGGGRIINFSDWVAASGRPRYKGYLPYYVAKRAVIGLIIVVAAYAITTFLFTRITGAASGGTTFNEDGLAN